jgi:hypothetical protein
MLHLLVAALVAVDTPDPGPELEQAKAAYAKLDSREATRHALLEKLFASSVESGEWHVVGHFPYAGHGKHDLARVHAPEGELLALRANSPAPDFTKSWAGKRGTTATWRSVGVGTDRRIDLRTFHDGRDDLATDYVHGTLVAKEATTLVAQVGSDDGLMLWVNGKLLVDKDVPRSLERPFDVVRIALAKGTNHVVAKVANGFADFAFEIDTKPQLDADVEAWLTWRLDDDFPRSRERLYWRPTTVRAPEELSLEVGGLDVFRDTRATAPRDRVVACTRRGDVFLVDGAFEMPPIAAQYTLFASGLHEPLGAVAKIVDGKLEVWCVQRGELTRLVDLDGDDRADLYDAVCDGWGVSGNYHEFAFGPKFDRDGNAWVTLNVGFCGGLGKSEVPWRGWALKVTPGRELVPVCAGARSPNGIGLDATGQMFYVDNQGDWVETNLMKKLAPGEYLGHPAGLRWRDDVQRDASGAIVPPPNSPAVVWFPYEKMGQSTADVLLDTTNGKFGPFAGQLLCGELTLARLLRVDLEQVDGQWQGACFPWLEGLDSGVNRLAFASDGSLLVGETDRGWGSVGRFRQGLERVVWSGKTPCELARMRIEPDGFRLEFTAPVDATSAANPASYRLTSYTYEHHAPYGCPEMDAQPHAIAKVELLDAKTVRLHLDRLRPGYVHELHLDGLRSAEYTGAAEKAGSPLLHSVAYYTVQKIPALKDAAPSKGPQRSGS